MTITIKDLKNYIEENLVDGTFKESDKVCLHDGYASIEDVPLQTSLNKGRLIKNLKSGTFTNKTVVNTKADSAVNKLK